MPEVFVLDIHADVEKATLAKWHDNGRCLLQQDMALLPRTSNNFHVPLFSCNAIAPQASIQGLESTLCSAGFSLAASSNVSQRLMDVRILGLLLNSASFGMRPQSFRRGESEDNTWFKCLLARSILSRLTNATLRSL